MSATKTTRTKRVAQRQEETVLEGNVAWALKNRTRGSIDVYTIRLRRPVKVAGLYPIGDRFYDSRAWTPVTVKVKEVKQENI